MSNPGFLLAEDSALKTRLAQMEASPGRHVQVFYRHPEKDTEKTYPMATIELMDINHATDRQESERWYYHATTVGLTPEEQGKYSDLDYYPSTLDKAQLDAMTAGGGMIFTEQFVPVNLIYQVTTYTRSARDDRALTALMLRRVTPFRRGFVYVPEDDTMRRLDLLNWNGTDILDGEAGYKKRIFRKAYTLSMSAEIPAADLIGIRRVLDVQGTLSDLHNQDNPVLTSSFSEEF